MKKKFDGFKLSGCFVNLTGQKIAVYETSSGKVRFLPPVRKKLPDEPADSSEVYYVLNVETVEKLKLSKRSLSDIAMVCDCSRSNDGAMVSRLVWGEDPTVPVLLYDGVQDSCYSF